MELKTFQPIYRYFKENRQYVKNMTFEVWEKILAHLRKMFSKIPIDTRALDYVEAVFDFEGWLENVF